MEIAVGQLLKESREFGPSVLILETTTRHIRPGPIYTQFVHLLVP